MINNEKTCSLINFFPNCFSHANGLKPHSCPTVLKPTPSLSCVAVGATHASPLLNDAPLDTCRDTACRALWILALVPPPPYTLPITILSTSSLTSSAYLIVRDPGHYRVASLSRGSHVTNGKRMGAVVAAVDGVSNRGAGFQPASGASTCLRWR
jgi:hypothetical protein